MSKILPGDYVAAIEEYAPGFGVYAGKDSLYSSNVGDLQLDAKTHSAKVNVNTRIPKLQSVGTVTIGLVADVMENVAVVDLIPFRSKNFDFVPNGVTAVLHVSSVKREYVRSLRDEVRAGDIVRVQITEVSRHSVRLTTAEKNLGVIKAFCSICRSPMVKAGYQLKCPACDSVETRKMAMDYGSGNIL